MKVNVSSTYVSTKNGKKTKPDQALAGLVRVSACRLKGPGFNSVQGHMHGLWLDLLCGVCRRQAYIIIIIIVMIILGTNKYYLLPCIFSLANLFFFPPVI